ncbi:MULTISPECIES: quercetin 2,3-dioxygenase [unclassified Streptomyces]|uniref:quercetin 2,3-dioxygenase n=1 Tax=unclassified Streptomyces TaxID=2593676 RepID=UPI0040428917
MTIEYATQYRTRSHIPPQPGKPYFIEKGQGDRAHLFGDLFTIYAGGEQTENTFNFFTCEGPKGDIIPAHSHPETYEVFYVTQGAVRLFVEDLQGEQYEKLLGPGDFGFVPKNCPHAYRMERHHTQIAGVAAGPGGTFERFFENLGTPTDELTLPARLFVPAPERFATVPAEYDVRFLPGHTWRTEG